MPVQTSCPACSQQVRVPDQLLGKNVKCPKCGHVFLAVDTSGYAPPPTPYAPPPPPPPSYQEPSDTYDDQQPEYDDYGEERPRRRRRRRSRGSDASGRLTAPAICLLITGILWLLYAVINTGVVVAQGGMEGAMKENPLMKGGAGGDNKAAMAVGFYGALILGPILGILVTAGGACMLGRKLRGLAMAGSIAAMIPCSPCCLLGIPFGIWSLVVLANQDVKDAFT